MLTFLALICLAATAGAAPQLVPELASTYLPVEPEPTYPKPSSTCLPAKDIYKTEYVSVPVNKVVEKIKQVVVPETNYVSSTLVIPKIISRKVVKTEIVPVPEVKVIVSTLYHTQIKKVSVPGPNRIIERIVTSIEPVVKTSYETVSRVVRQKVPKLEIKTIRSSQIVQKTVEVPQISTKTHIERQQLPDNISTKVKYINDVVYKTETLPQQVVVNTVVETRKRIETRRQQDQPRIVTVDRSSVKTIIQRVVKTEIVPQVINKVQTNYNTRNVVKYLTRVVKVPVTKVIQREIPVTDYKTEVKKHTVIDTKYETRAVTKVQQLPGQTSTVIKVQVIVKTQIIPGAIKTIQKNVFKTNTIIKVNTVVKPQISKVIKTNIVKESCGGYNYDTLRNPLVF